MVAADRSSIASYVASISVFGGSMTVNELAALGGLLIAVLTFATNIYFKARHLRLAERAVVKKE
jgi:hypothetical protein